jgi:hypothetical protein
MKAMDIIKSFIITVLLLVLASSCSNDELPVYEDVGRIYFENSDLKDIKLGYDDPVKADSTVSIEVIIVGRLADVDRPITAEVIKTESTAIAGTDIEILPSVIPAGETKGDLRVKVNNSEKLNKMTLSARIRLTPNEFFHTDLNEGGRLEYSVSFDAIADMPLLWTLPANNQDFTLNQYFGPWSRTKELLLYELFGFTREFLEYDPATQNPTEVLNSRIPDKVAMGMIAQVNRYLRDYKSEHDGEPLLDENGIEIKMGLGIL